MRLEISVQIVQLSEVDGKKQHRMKAGYSGHAHGSIREGWPDVGLPEPDKHMPVRWNKPNRKVRALVPDTPENRAAFEVIREGLRAITRKLETVLGPENIAHSLLAAASGLMLSSDAGKDPKKKRKPRRVTGEK